MAKAAAPKKANSAFMKPMNLSDELTAVVGKGPMPRSEITSKIWEYIKGDDFVDDKGKKGSSLRKGATLQDAKNKRNINADDALLKIFAGKKTVTMFELPGFIGKHLT